MNHLRSFLMQFFHQIWNNYFLLEAMALHCTKVESSSYHFMLKYEKLFSGNCTQFSSQLLNCPRWGVCVSGQSWNSRNLQIPTAARGWAAPAWLRWKLWRQNFQKCNDKHPTLARRSMARLTSIWGVESWPQIFGDVSWCSRIISLHSCITGRMACALVIRLDLSLAGSNTILQTGVKATSPFAYPIPKNTTSARLLPPEQSSEIFSCGSHQWFLAAHILWRKQDFHRTGLMLSLQTHGKQLGGGGGGKWWDTNTKGTGYHSRPAM